jgi:hypothetical protein
MYLDIIILIPINHLIVENLCLFGWSVWGIDFLTPLVVIYISELHHHHTHHNHTSSTSTGTSPLYWEWTGRMKSTAENIRNYSFCRFILSKEEKSQYREVDWSQALRLIVKIGDGKGVKNKNSCIFVSGESGAMVNSQSYMTIMKCIVMMILNEKDTVIM